MLSAEESILEDALNEVISHGFNPRAYYQFKAMIEQQAHLGKNMGRYYDALDEITGLYLQDIVDYNGG